VLLQIALRVHHKTSGPTSCLTQNLIQLKALHQKFDIRSFVTPEDRNMLRKMFYLINNSQCHGSWFHHLFPWNSHNTDGIHLQISKGVNIHQTEVCRDRIPELFLGTEQSLGNNTCWCSVIHNCPHFWYRLANTLLQSTRFQQPVMPSFQQSSQLALQKIST
jgi:hypothetical protein